MISTNTLSIYILQQDQNDICDQNICSIQDAMRSDKPAGSKSKQVYTDLPNLEVLTNIATPGDIQVMYLHAYVGNKSLDETVTAFALAESLEAPTVVLIDIERSFAGDSERILLLTMEVLLRAAASELAKSKNLQD